MSISGIGYHYRQDNTAANKNHNTKTEAYLPKKDAWEPETPEKTTQNASARDIYEAYRTRSAYQQAGVKEESSEEEKSSDIEEQKTDTEIIVKPDGSKIMMTTIRVGGMETVMSMEIAKPTGTLEGNIRGTVENPNMMVSDTDAAIESVPDK